MKVAQANHLRKIQDELRINMSGKREAALQLALIIADEMMRGEIDIIGGVEKIKNKAIDSFDFFHESKHSCYDSIHFQTVYALYDTYQDLLNDNLPWNKDKTNEQIQEEIKILLADELKVWRNKMKKHP